MTQNVAVQHHIALSALPQNTKRYNVEGLQSGGGKWGARAFPPPPPWYVNQELLSVLNIIWKRLMSKKIVLEC